MNTVLKTVLHLSLLIIGPTVALMLAHRWPTGGPPVAQLACHMPLLGQRWPTGQNDVGPPVAANGGPTAEPPVAQRWATGVVLSSPWLYSYVYRSGEYGNRLCMDKEGPQNIYRSLRSKSMRFWELSNQNKISLFCSIGRSHWKGASM